MSLTTTSGPTWTRPPWSPRRRTAPPPPEATARGRKDMTSAPSPPRRCSMMRMSRCTAQALPRCHLYNRSRRARHDDSGRLLVSAKDWTDHTCSAQWTLCRWAACSHVLCCDGALDGAEDETVGESKDAVGGSQERQGATWAPTAHKVRPMSTLIMPWLLYINLRPHALIHSSTLLPTPSARCIPMQSQACQMD
jgi:hypothetical protein